jgi:hypothetical protein
LQKNAQLKISLAPGLNYEKKETLLNSSAVPLVDSRDRNKSG